MTKRQRRCSIVNFSTGRSIAPECVHLSVFTWRLCSHHSQWILVTPAESYVTGVDAVSFTLETEDRCQVFMFLCPVWKTRWWIFVFLHWPAAAALSLFHLWKQTWTDNSKVRIMLWKNNASQRSNISLHISWTENIWPQEEDGLHQQHWSSTQTQLQSVNIRHVCWWNTASCK